MADRQFPVICVDDFYDDPYKIRDFALSCEFSKPDGNYPGERTVPLYQINPAFFRSFCNRLFSLYFHYPENNGVDGVGWSIDTYFQKIYPFHEDPTSPLNSGWIHKDNGFACAGVIYLNPDSYSNAGTSFYKLKKDIFHVDADYELRNELYAEEELDLDEYKTQQQKVNNQYIKTVEVGNVFNRLAFYGADIPHKENCFVASDTEPRLTQVFFVEKIKSTLQSSPLSRIKEHEIEF